MIKQVLGALVLATVMSTAALAADAPAAGDAMKAAAPAAVAAPAADAAKTEKCEVTKDGKTTTTEVAVGACEKEGGKVVKAEEKKAEGDAMKAPEAAAPADKK